MSLIKKILYKTLSEKQYLKTLHRSFYSLYRLGFLKRQQGFKYHYMIQKLINKDDVVVDIGANLGYFSKTFARLTSNGKLVCIEPIPVFFDVLQHFLKAYPQVSLYNVALGKEQGAIEMVLPHSDGFMRTGLPHVLEQGANDQNFPTRTVAVVKGSELLAGLEKIDYIKCDIEGYEKVVFEELKPLIQKHQPFVQIEISEKNRESMLEYFKALGYVQFGISNFSFIQEEGLQNEEGDFFFVPEKRLQHFKKKFSI